MDYLDPDTRRSHTRRLFLGYGLMAIVIGLGTILLVLLAYGYTFDRTSRSIIQNGLLFIQMEPVNAEVYINGELRGTGNQRLVLPAGSYAIEIRQDGYRAWYNDIDLSGGSVERFQYPLLFPEQIVGRTYRTFTAEPRLMTASPDRRWLLIQEAEQVDAFVLYDLRRQINLPTFFSLPVGVINSGSSDSSLELVEWSNDNQHVVLRHSFDDTEEYILLNHDDVSLSQNLSMRYADIDFTDISLVDKQADEYHLFDRVTGKLVYARLASDTTTLLLEDVVTYRSHGADRILFVSSGNDLLDNSSDKENDEDELSVVLLDDAELYQIMTLPAGEASDYLLDLARFRSDWYVIAGTKNQRRIIGYKNPIEQLGSDRQQQLAPSFTLRTDEMPDRVTFSGNARNVLLQSAEDVAVFDLEREQGYRYSFNDSDRGRANWMDGHRIISTWNNQLHVIDFDGRNQQQLADCLTDSEVVFDTGYEFMYCVAPSEDNIYGSLVRYSLLAVDESD